MLEIIHLCFLQIERKSILHQNKQLSSMLWTGVQKKLALHCKTENQNVRYLCDILKRMMRKNIQASRAIVFVKARATCIALAAFLKKDFKGLGIDVQCLYGKENGGGEDGKILYTSSFELYYRKTSADLGQPVSQSYLDLHCLQIIYRRFHKTSGKQCVRYLFIYTCCKNAKTVFS